MDVSRRGKEANDEREQSQVNGRTGEFLDEMVDSFHLYFLRVFNCFWEPRGQPNMSQLHPIRRRF